MTHFDAPHHMSRVFFFLLHSSSLCQPLQHHRSIELERAAFYASLRQRMPGDHSPVMRPASASSASASASASPASALETAALRRPSIFSQIVSFNDTLAEVAATPFKASIVRSKRCVRFSFASPIFLGFFFYSCASVSCVCVVAVSTRVIWPLTFLTRPLWTCATKPTKHQVPIPNYRSSTFSIHH